MMTRSGRRVLEIGSEDSLFDSVKCTKAVDYREANVSKWPVIQLAEPTETIKKTQRVHQVEDTRQGKRGIVTYSLSG